MHNATILAAENKQLRAAKARVTYCLCVIWELSVKLNRNQLNRNSPLWSFRHKLTGTPSILTGVPICDKSVPAPSLHKLRPTDDTPWFLRYRHCSRTSLQSSGSHESWSRLPVPACCMSLFLSPSQNTSARGDSEGGGCVQERLRGSIGLALMSGYASFSTSYFSATYEGGATNRLIVSQSSNSGWNYILTRFLRCQWVYMRT